MKTLLIILMCLLFALSAGAQGFQGATVIGGAKLATVFVNGDSLYTKDNLTGIIAVGDVVTTFSKVDNVKRNILVTDITATSIELAASWLGPADTELMIELANRPLAVNNLAGKTMMYANINSNGEPVIYMRDDDGNLMSITAAGDTLHFAGASKYIFDGIVRAPGFDPPHLFVGFGDSTAVVDCTQDAWAQITNAGDNLFAVNDTTRITYAVGDTLVVQNTGDYKMDAVVSFQGNNGETWKVGFLKAGTLIDYAMRRYTSTNDTGNLSVTAYETLTAGDKVVLAIMNLTDNDDPTIVSATIWMTKVRII
jgi:hypothetical protein